MDPYFVLFLTLSAFALLFYADNRCIRFLSKQDTLSVELHEIIREQREQRDKTLWDHLRE